MTDTPSVLSADRVEAIFFDCLFQDNELSDERAEAIRATPEAPPDGVIVTRGIVTSSALHTGRVETHREEIVAMLNELPTEFLSVELGGAGGWSFLNACLDKNGVQWTGLHQTQDRLVQLGLAVGAASYLLERSMWAAFPGGMPYFVVTEAPSGAPKKEGDRNAR